MPPSSNYFQFVQDFLRFYLVFPQVELQEALGEVVVQEFQVKIFRFLAEKRKAGEPRVDD